MVLVDTKRNAWVHNYKMQCVLLFLQLQNEEHNSGSENNSKPVLQNPMHLKLKNS